MGLIDLKIVFLFFLLVTGVLLVLRRGPILGFKDVGLMILDFLLIPTILGTVITFALIITGTDPMRLILQASAQVGGLFNVSFLDAIPEHLQDPARLFFADDI